MNQEIQNTLKQVHNMLMGVSTSGDSSILMARALLELRGLVAGAGSGEEAPDAE